MLQTYKNQLKDEGYTIIPLKDGPFDEEAFKHIYNATSPSKIQYTASIAGDTDEQVKVEFFRLKHPSLESKRLPDVLEIIESDHFTNYLKDLTSQDHFAIDRVQAHYYTPGGFCGWHIDTEQCPEWSHTVLLMLEPCEKGGEFIFWNSQDKRHQTDLKSGDLLVLDASYPHEVLPIELGTRKVFIFFLNVC